MVVTHANVIDVFANFYLFFLFTAEIVQSISMILGVARGMTCGCLLRTLKWVDCILRQLLLNPIGRYLSLLSLFCSFAFLLFFLFGRRGSINGALPLYFPTPPPSRGGGC